MNYSNRNIVWGIFQWLERVTDDRKVQGSNPASATSKLAIYQCLSEYTLKVGDPCYLMTMPGKVNNPTQVNL